MQKTKTNQSITQSINKTDFIPHETPPDQKRDPETDALRKWKPV